MAAVAIRVKCQRRARLQEIRRGGVLLIVGRRIGVWLPASRAVPGPAGELDALGRAVRELRLARGLSQEDLAYWAGLHRTYVGGIERGERNVAFLNILKLARALDVAPSELMAKYERARFVGRRGAGRPSPGRRPGSR